MQSISDKPLNCLPQIHADLQAKEDSRPRVQPKRKSPDREKLEVAMF